MHGSNRPRRVRADHCFACERYIGHVVVCPYCEAPTPHGPVLILSRILCLCLAICGLVGMLLAARRTIPPNFDVSVRSPLDDGRYAAFEGTVAGPVTLKRNGDDSYFRTTVTNASGRLTVQAYGTVADAIGSAPLPLNGQRLQVRGVLRVRPRTAPALVLQHAGHMCIIAGGRP